MREVSVLVTCEHGGCEVPKEWQRLFRGARDVLRSHRGLDIGALGVARRLADRVNAPLISSTTTRLLIELNRSIEHPRLFSEFSAGLSEAERARLVDTYYVPYRGTVERVIGSLIGSGRRVLHVSVHSFTDVLDGDVRELEIGLLFDPARVWEVAVCGAWRGAIEGRCGGGFRVRENEPYAGVDDGLTTHLRGMFGGDVYAGVELEIRQGLIGRGGEQRRFGDVLAETMPGGMVGGGG